MKIAFRSNQLCERGTEVALFDYAFYNYVILGNESIIIAQNSTNNKEKVIMKFKNRFKDKVFIYPTGDNKEMERILKEEKVDAMYNIVHGCKEDNLSQNVPNLIHCVFECGNDRRIKSSDKQAAICEYLSMKDSNGTVPWIPHIIEKHNITWEDEIGSDLRNELGIPLDSKVFGRLGGQNTFNIKFVHDMIYILANENPDMYFIFLNTDKFCDDMRNIIHLPMKTSIVEKYRFINTCDAMLHARYEGEIFSIALGEFSVNNKPIISYSYPADTGHFHVFGEKIIKYSNESEFYDILSNFNREYMASQDWDVYKDIYSPLNVMNKFKEVFLS